MLHLAELLTQLTDTDEKIAVRFGWPLNWRQKLDLDKKFRRKVFSQLSSGKGRQDRLVSGATKAERREGYTALPRHPRRFKIR